MAYSHKISEIADFHEVVIRGARAFQYTQEQSEWVRKNTTLSYDCPSQPELEQKEGTLLYAWSVISGVNMYRALQIGKILKLTPKGIDDKNIANNKIKSTILLAHGIGILFDNILSPKEMIEGRAGKILHYAPDIVASFSNGYRLADKGKKITAVLKELAIKLFLVSSTFFKDAAEEEYHSTFDDLCAESTAPEREEEKNIHLEMHNMHVDNMAIIGNRVEIKGEAEGDALGIAGNGPEIKDEF